jgi:hypothetical protein
VTINRNTGDIVRSGYHFRDKVAKASGAEVQTGVFQDAGFAGLSALLCSRVDVANHPEEMGTDFELVPNPHAKNALPTDFRLRGTYYEVKPVGDGYDVMPQYRP